MIDWNRVKFELYETGTSRWPGGISVLPERAWYAPHDDLWIIWAGQGRVKLRSSWRTVGPGTCLWREGGTRFPGEQDPADPIGLTYVHFRITDAHDQPVTREQVGVDEAFQSPDPASTEAAGRRIVTLLAGYGRPSAQCLGEARSIAIAIFKGLLMDLVFHNNPLERLRFPEADPRHRNLMDLAHRIINEPQNAPTMEAMASECGYSWHHFRKLFKQVIGRSPNDFVLYWRIEMAKRLLTQTGLSVGQVAAAIGFDDQSYFSRQFSRRMGVSPRAFRRGVDSTGRPSGEHP